MPSTSNVSLRLPNGFRKRLLKLEDKQTVLKLLRKKSLNTVCEEAKCPNIGECFKNKTATFMILGDKCTRRCLFCAVKTARPFLPDPEEPKRLALAIQDLGLDHAVITSVDRDDLKDKGAKHFSDCIHEVRKVNPKTTIELLTPDFKGKRELIDLVLEAKPQVFGHNIETVKRLYKSLRPQSSWETTCSVLTQVSKMGSIQVKSGMMVGLGESDLEVLETLRMLSDIGVNVVTIGQYLKPSLKHWPVDRYVDEDRYKKWVDFGLDLGFQNVFAGAFVRSSYRAKETYINSIN